MTARATASGLGMSYEQAADDVAGVEFKSIRHDQPGGQFYRKPPTHYPVLTPWADLAEHERRALIRYPASPAILERIIARHAERVELGRVHNLPLSDPARLFIRPPVRRVVNPRRVRAR